MLFQAVVVVIRSVPKVPNQPVAVAVAEAVAVALTNAIDGAMRTALTPQPLRVSQPSSMTM